MTAPTLFDEVREIGTTAAEACADKAERQGWDSEAAGRFILAYLAQHGETAGEVLVSECKRENAPHDDRAFGAVFGRLRRAGLIYTCRFVMRTKGHGTAGGRVWKLTEGRR